MSVDTWSHISHTNPTLSFFFCLNLSCWPTLHFICKVLRLHCLNRAGVRWSLCVSLFVIDCLSGDSPLWRPWVSCRKSIYDALCVYLGGEEENWGSEVRGRVKGAFLTLPIIRKMAKSEKAQHNHLYENKLVLASSDWNIYFYSLSWT